MEPKSEYINAFPAGALLALAALVFTGCSSDSSSNTQTYNITADAGSNGTISPTSIEVEEGDSTEFTLEPETGFGILSASGCGGSLEGDLYITGAITGECTVEAAFELLPPSTPVLDLAPQAIKTLSFSWDDIGTQSEFRLLEDPTGDSGYTEIATFDADTTAHDRVVSLPARVNARYILQACNSAGCTDSEAVHVSGQLVNAIGYIKPSNISAFDNFGSSVALSEDGKTLAVGVRGENSSTTGVGSVPNSSASNAGAVYVFTRDGSDWAQQAYIKSSNTGAHHNFGAAVSLSADGNTLVAGAPGEESSTSGVNSDPNTAAGDAGAAYVFVRSGGIWGQQAYIKASDADENHEFGGAVALSGDGDTLAVGARWNDTAYVFTRSDGDWSEQAALAGNSTSDGDLFGISVALSNDGDILAVGATWESSGTTGVNSNPDSSAADAGAVYVFRREGSNWDQEAYIKASNTAANHRFGRSVALSSDGHTLAVGAFWEDSSTTGVGSLPDNDASKAGAAYVFTRSDTLWAEQAYIKASNTAEEAHFGVAVSLSAAGDVLAVGAEYENSDTVGLGSVPNANTDKAGAAYVFTRTGSVWDEQAYIKAANTGEGHWFGGSLAVSGDGQSLAVGARRENSSSTGIGSEPDSNATSAGAVYLY